MTYSTQLYLLLATLPYGKSCQGDHGMVAPASLQDCLQPTLQKILDLADQFRTAPVCPESTSRFEQQVQVHLREAGRLVVQHTFNALEPQDVAALPQHVHFEGTTYTRLNRKTQQQVWTLFGQICLRRVGYRSTNKDGQGCLFPLAQTLGLLHGATPALASHAGRLFCGAGMTQSLTRERLRADNDVGWGVKKLRQFLAALAQRLTPLRHECQVERLLQWLAQAQATQGKHAPVLSVGRDGICLGIRGKKKCVFEVATTATVSVYERNGKRLGTVYLAYVPQAEQTRMSQELTRLVRGVLKGCKGELPRLCYVTDAGKSETAYYKRVLAVMRHPLTRLRLKWVRVVDYYHASQRLWTMAERLLRTEQARTSWAKKMLRWLLLPGGVNRVLHSAAALAWRLGLRGKKKAEFEKAYRYLSKRMKYLRYAEYKSQGIPLGSGVTEAACKTVYTQRLKLSGMRWNGAAVARKDAAGAQTVLDLRVLLLSGIWDRVFLLSLQTSKVANILTNKASSPDTPELAA